jgi:hypothetical protein
VEPSGAERKKVQHAWRTVGDNAGCSRPAAGLDGVSSPV